MCVDGHVCMNEGIRICMFTYACFAGLAGLHAVPLVYEGAEAGYNEDIASEGC